MPCGIHIATEGPLGYAARRFCVKHGLPFTTAFHTRFPEYVEARFKIPISWSYPVMRWFHNPSKAVMAPTSSVVNNLIENGFENVRLWGRGVDTKLFKPGPAAEIPGEGTVHLYVGRAAVEKNIEAFLRLKVQGRKVVVGDGPQLPMLRSRFPDVHFVGAKHGDELVSYYNAADVFVFPSLTDTFGLVMIEALACGVPVAAFPVMGPKDVITSKKIGCLDEDLHAAIRNALQKNREDCRAFAEARSWKASAETFQSYLHEFDPSRT
jgi:glycosyltransferase involved in cell wall biosynthesis